MNRSLCVLWILLPCLAARAVVVVGPWQPAFQGVEQAVGHATVDASNLLQQAVHVLRVDLTDPGVELFTDPPCTNCPGYETIGRTTTGFVEAYKLQGAVNCAFFPAGAVPNEPMQVHGLLISRGVLVSSNWTAAEGGNGPYATILRFTTNKVGSILPLDVPPASEAGMYTAVAGNRVLLSNGVVQVEDYNPQPRTALGLSQDGRYLFMLTIDGRQTGYSDGGSDMDTANWLLLFGAYNAINVDGGGSTTMAIEQCPGKAVLLGSPIEDDIPGLQRVVSGHFGFYAKPPRGFINDVSVAAGGTNATITWTTLSNATTQVEYGLTENYDGLTQLNAALTTNHSVAINGLVPLTNYFFRVISRVGTNIFSRTSCFATTYHGFWGGDLTNVWKYNTNNLGAGTLNWTAKSYNDSSWPSGPGLLWVDLRATPNAAVQPKGTQLPPTSGATHPFPTYYFRRHFTVPGNPAGVSLIFSNYLDDGAIFYLNGVEIHRAFMPATPPTYTALASSYNCGSGDATCADVFTISGAPMTNLLSGDNVLAVEVHNFALTSPDITFGSAMFVVLPPPVPLPPFIQNLTALPTENGATISWRTVSNATTRLEFGLADTLVNSTPTNASLTTNHTVTLSNLSFATSYHFRAVSTVSSNEYSARGVFTTAPLTLPLFSLTSVWRFTTNNLDGVNWFARDYNDSGWLGQGPALLAVEDNPAVSPINTVLPGISGALPPTYYFRTHFLITNSVAGLTLLFSNYVDDGAVFYLNGAEIFRLRMGLAPQPVHYFDIAANTPPSGDAVAPELVRLCGDVMTNLLSGDNVLAAEVHQADPGSSDIVFGSAMFLTRLSAAESKLRVAPSNHVVSISWDGGGLTLQQASDPGNPAAWSDVPGFIRTSPFVITNGAAMRFFRLRN